VAPLAVRDGRLQGRASATECRERVTTPSHARSRHGHEDYLEGVGAGSLLAEDIRAFRDTGQVVARTEGELESQVVVSAEVATRLGARLASASTVGRCAGKGGLAKSSPDARSVDHLWQRLKHEPGISGSSLRRSRSGTVTTSSSTLVGGSLQLVSRRICCPQRDL